MQTPWYVPDEITIGYERGTIDNHAFIGSLEDEVLSVGLTYYIGGPREVITYQSRQDFRDTMLALDRAEARAVEPEKLADGIRVPIPGTGEYVEVGGVAASIIAVGVTVVALLLKQQRKKKRDASDHHHHPFPNP